MKDCLLYGYDADSEALGLQRQLQVAVNVQDWKTVSDIAQTLLTRDQQQATSMGTPLAAGQGL